MSEIGFYPGEIQIPDCDLKKWSVVACDQYTSEPSYWEEVARLVGEAPSAYQIIFPEVYLGKVDFDEKIDSINHTMKEYLSRNLFTAYPQSLVYVERTLLDGSVRKGILGILDLEQYDYRKGSDSLIRATEGTVVERIPPRVRIRKDAPLEIPHILVLIDDPEQNVVEPCAKRIFSLPKLYDFDLCQNGGHISGWLLDPDAYGEISKGLAALAEPKRFREKYHAGDAPVLLYAVGDGNHSLASAKECWNLKKQSLTAEEAKQDPARYALVELGNLHDPSLQFEAIHRVLFGADETRLLAAFRDYAANLNGEGEIPPQTVRLVTRGGEEDVCFKRPVRTLGVGTLQDFLDGYLQTNEGTVDYIHGGDVVRELVKGGAVGFLLPAMEKTSLFPTVIKEGALPRKTFSMGEASEKRFYLECRKI